MSFHEVRIDDGLVIFETEGGPEFSTEVTITSLGNEKRQQNYVEGLGSWNYGERTVLDTELTVIEAFFRARKGKTYGFRKKDWGDFAATNTQGRLGTTSAGTGTPVYDCYKRYSDAGGSDDRRIWKLRTGTIIAYRNGSAVTAGAGAGQVSIDVNNGRITWVADASQAITGHTPGASHQFTTAANITQLAVGDKVYISGVTGSADTKLNGIAHTISNKTGSGPFTWTISTTTTALTASGGTAFAYPQADEPLAWAGEFDKTVRFGTDKLIRRFLAKDGNNLLFDLASLPVVETLDP